jgi:hypothetical protein
MSFLKCNMQKLLQNTYILFVHMSGYVFSKWQIHAVNISEQPISSNGGLKTFILERPLIDWCKYNRTFIYFYLVKKILSSYSNYWTKICTYVAKGILDYCRFVSFLFTGPQGCIVHSPGYVDWRVGMSLARYALSRLNSWLKRWLLDWRTDDPQSYLRQSFFYMTFYG